MPNVARGHPRDGRHIDASEIIDRRQCMIPPCTSHASAPTRIDLAGGTLDIWPLYLFHERRADAERRDQPARAAATLRPRTRPRGSSIVSEDTGSSASRSTTGRELRDNHDLRLLGRLLHYFQAEGLELHDAIGVAGRRRHRRLVGAEHRRLRRAATPGAAAPDRGRALADRDERRGAGDRRADRRRRTTGPRSTAGSRRSSSASTASAASRSPVGRDGAAAAPRRSPTPTRRATPASTTGT